MFVVARAELIMILVGVEVLVERDGEDVLFGVLVMYDEV